MSELSVQLYTVREALAQDFDGTLGKLASFGFTQVEPKAARAWAVIPWAVIYSAAFQWRRGTAWPIFPIV